MPEDVDRALSEVLNWCEQGLGPASLLGRGRLAEWARLNLMAAGTLLREIMVRR